MVEFAGIAGQALDLAFEVLIWLVVALAAGAAIWWYFQWKRFNTTVFIFEEDENGKITNLVNPKLDKGGVYVDKKTNLKLFFLKANKVGLKPDKIPVIKFGKMQSVFLIQRGLKNFSYARFPSNFSSNPGNVQMKVYDEDISWAQNAYLRAKKTFGENWLTQFAPYIGLGIMGVLILAMIVVVLQKFDVLQDVANALVQVSENMARANTGTTVVQ